MQGIAGPPDVGIVETGVVVGAGKACTDIEAGPASRIAFGRGHCHAGEQADAG